MARGPQTTPKKTQTGKKRQKREGNHSKRQKPRKITSGKRHRAWRLDGLGEQEICGGDRQGRIKLVIMEGCFF